MNLTTLLAEFRERAGDTETPYLWSDARATAWLNEAQDEAAIRKRLLFDRTTIALDTPVADTYTAGSGSLANGTYYYRVSAFNESGETLAHTESSFATTSGGVNVTWEAVTGAQGYKIYGRSTGAELYMATVYNVLTWEDDGSVTPAGALPSSNTTEDVVKIDVYEGYPRYNTHASIFEVVKARLESSGTFYDLKIYDREEMDRLNSEWRESEERPTGLFVDEGSIEFNTQVDADYTLWLEVYRRPLNEISSTVEPEIDARHHMRMIDWALYRAFGKRDVHTFDQDLSGQALRRFENYFGFRPQANMHKRLRANTPLRNKCWP